MMFYCIAVNVEFLNAYIISINYNLIIWNSKHDEQATIQ